MKYTEIKDRIAVEPTTMLKEKKVLLSILKQKLKTMRLTNSREINEVRKNIARINTAISALK